MIEGEVTFNGLTMNRPAFTKHFIKGDREPGAWQSPFYWYRIVAFDGLWSDPLNFETVQIPQVNQTRSGDKYTSGKTIVLTGIVEGKTLADLRSGQLALRNAFFADPLPVSDLEFYIGGAHLRLVGGYANQQIQMPDQQQGFAWKRAFSLQLYFDDPYVYDVGTGGGYTGWA